MKRSWVVFFLVLVICLGGMSISSIRGLFRGPVEHAPLRTVLSGHLIDAQGNAVDATALRDKRYVLLYFSAGWCIPCHAFTPKLVDFYNENGGGQDFEVIYVSGDYNAEDMQAYMDEYNMPWPAVRYDDIRTSGILERFPDRGIPDLEMLDGTGQVVSGTGVNNVYVYPGKVLEDLKQALR